MRLPGFLSPREKRGVPLDAIALLLLLNIAVGIVASLFATRYSTVVREASLERLEAIATLKLTQINSWRSERLQDAWAFFENTIISRAVVDYIRAPGDPTLRLALEPILEAVVRRAQYRSVSIVGPKGSSLLSFPESAGALPPRALGMAKDMARARMPALSDPFLDSDGLVRIIIVSPVLDPATSDPMGAVAIEVDPMDSLYPLIAEWPIPSPTAEAYIVREQEGRVKYLSELRFHKGVVLFSIAASAEDSMVGYQATHGLQGPTEGKDYRGVPVYASIRKIGGLPWFLVVKVDKEEVAAEIRFGSRLGLMALSVVMLVLSAWVIVRWSGQSARSKAERDQLRSRLRKARELESIALLAGGVAHDFNNTLAGISGYAEALKSRLAEGPLREQAQRIFEVAKKGSHVVHGLLAFSEKRQMRSEPIELNAMLIAQREALRESLGPAIALRLELAPGELHILGDVDHLREALGHLAQNAKDAMPAGGSFTVQATARELAGEFSDANGKALRGPFASLVVSDTGIGMDEATQKRLFEPFFTTKEFGSSAGIGLAAIYGIVRQHDGFIDVRSAPGEGAAFTILIPLADDPSRD